MQTDRQLRWAHENRCGRTGVQRLGDLARASLDRQASASRTWRGRLAAILTEEVGSGLMEHVAVAGLRRGVLRLEVDEPAVLYSLRVHWEQKLLSTLHRDLPGAGVHTVRFTLRGCRA